VLAQSDITARVTANKYRRFLLISDLHQPGSGAANLAQTKRSFAPPLRPSARDELFEPPSNHPIALKRLRHRFANGARRLPPRIGAPGEDLGVVAVHGPLNELLAFEPSLLLRRLQQRPKQLHLASLRSELRSGASLQVNSRGCERTLPARFIVGTP